MHHATSDNIKTYEELFDDMVEAVQHAEAVDAELTRAKATIEQLCSEAKQHRRIIGALCHRRPSGYRLEHRTLQEEHGFTVTDKHGALYVKLLVTGEGMEGE